ncbi:MAG: hypothetical protein E7J25_00850 [Paeniclostridium sordellii]|nr:hypothetical protein [Peptostreptococcaceae bacterium]MDU7965388.1 hypothetical protein [Paeniclostridium sordellii]
MKRTKKEKVLLPNILGFILIICVAYLAISLVYLVPYASNFFKNHYIIEPGDLPNFSDIFNSLFTVLNIIISSVLSYMVYKLYKDQYNAAYNKDIASSSILLYYTLKLNIMRSTSYFLNQNIKDLEEEYFIKKGSDIPQNSIYYIKTSQCPTLNYTETLKDHIPSVIGYIDDESIRTKLFYICEDLSSEYKKSNDVEDKLIYVLSSDLVQNSKLVEKSGDKWANVIENMYSDNWINLNENYKKLMNKLLELSKTKN